MRLRPVDLGIFAVFLLLAIALQWPAASLASWLEGRGDGHWRLADVDGHPWRGSGILLARTGDGAPWRSVQSLHWQWLWREMPAGRLAVDVALERGGIRLSADRDGVAVEQVDTHISATEISPLLPGALGRYAWTGVLHAQGAGYRCDWAGQTCGGEVDLLWNAAGVGEIPGAPLGDYRLRLVDEGGAMRLEIATVTAHSRLHIDGSGRIASGKLQFSGEAVVTAADDEALTSMLNTLGRISGTPGHYRIDYRG